MVMLSSKGLYNRKSGRCRESLKEKKKTFVPLLPESIVADMSISSCFALFFLSLLPTVSGFAVVHLPCFALSSAGDLADVVFGGPSG